VAQEKEKKCLTRKSQKGISRLALNENKRERQVLLKLNTNEKSAPQRTAILIACDC